MGKATISSCVFRAVITSQRKGPAKRTSRARSRIYLLDSLKRRRPVRRGEKPLGAGAETCIRISYTLVIAIDFVVDPETAGTQYQDSDRQDDHKEDPEHSRAIAKALVHEKLLIDIDHVDEIAAWDIHSLRDGIGF